jgi:hypothetical protein
MRRPAALYPIVLALGAIVLAQGAGGQEQDAREQGPIKIKTCQVISQSGSYVLANNLTGSNPKNNNCLFITASFVTIDLAGFTISEPTGSGGAAIASSELAQPLEGIAVQNGTMVGGAVGVVLIGGTGFVVKGVRVFADPSLPGQGQGIVVDGGIVKGNIVVGRGNGIQVGQGTTVIGNTALNNSGVGIDVICPANVTNNTATGNSVNIQLFGEGCNNTNNVAP